MAKKKNKDEDGDLLIKMAGIVLFLPFLPLSLIYFLVLKKRHLTPQAQRIVDTSRGIKAAIFSAGIIGTSAIFILAGTFGIFNEAKENIIAFKALFLVFCLCVMAYYGSRYVACIFLGIVVDPRKGVVVMPTDFQSYSLTDWLTLRFLSGMKRVDVIPLDGIEKISRSKGTELYLHGSFGSRRISMSSKQKRDECLAAIQSKSRKTVLIPELVGV